MTLENRYRVENLLGQGGMGAVYRAWDERLRMVVALKENALVTPDARAQFEREALVLARLHHSNLPKVTDHFVTADGLQYLVMTFIEGLNLAELLAAHGRQSPAQVTAWLGQVCDALTYLHSQNPPIIHRDIKPQNIKITPDGHVFLVDFGLSKVGSTYQSTASGALGVTPGFSPLEQYGSAHTDPRSDVYALTATLYAMLTGETPPESVNRAVGTAALILPHTINPDLGPALERALLHGLEMQPTNRPATVAVLRQELEVGLGSPIPSPPVPRPWPASDMRQVSRPSPMPALVQRENRLSGWVLVGVGALVVVLLAVGIAALRSGRQPTTGPGAVGDTITAISSATRAPATDIPIATAAAPIPPTDTPTVSTATRVPSVEETRVRNSDGAVMVYVPAGEFVMGSADGDSHAQADEQPQHTIILSAFWIDRTEVTNAQYRKFVEGGGYAERDYWTDAGWAWKEAVNMIQPDCWGDNDFDQPDQPVVCVSWHEADAYAHWAGGRLPSEAEWEKAACGTDGRVYPWGNEEPTATLANFDNEVGRTAPVGSYPAGIGPYGALDMAGNVWEWTGSMYQSYPYNPNDGREKRETSGDVRRVLRSGSWGNSADGLRCAFRGGGIPRRRSEGIGFRVVFPGL